MKRLRLVLLVFVAVASVLAAMAAAFYGIENWRGARVWEQAKRELAAAGETLDAESLIPPPVPDERNAALIPLFARELEYRADPATGRFTFGPVGTADGPSRAMPYGSAAGKPDGRDGSWTSGRAMDLDRVRDYYGKRKDFPSPEPSDSAAEGVLRALMRFAPELQELEDGLRERPEGRFPVDWWHEPPFGLRLPHYYPVQKLTQTLRLRAVASLAAGRHADAARDVVTAFRLRAIIQPEPTLIGHLVVMTCDILLLQTVWEGLAQRQWTAAELTEIQASLRRDDLLADYTQAVRGERNLYLHRTMEIVRRTGNWRGSFVAPDTVSDDVFAHALSWSVILGPRGWLDTNEAGLCMDYQQLLTTAMDVRTHRVRPEQLRAMDDERNAGNQMLSPKAFLRKMAFPVVESVLPRTTRTQSACEQAEVACALERHFLDRGMYPGALDALVPAYLDRVPHDLVDGAPMRYARTDDGRYRLYVVGWNGRDDGGTVAWPRMPGDTLRTDDKEGDWVWQYTPVPLPEGALKNTP